MSVLVLFAPALSPASLFLLLHLQTIKKAIKYTNNILLAEERGVVDQLFYLCYKHRNRSLKLFYIKSTYFNENKKFKPYIKPVP